MDASLKEIPIEIDKIEEIFNEIFNINIDDNVSFKIIGIKKIRIDNPYGGYRLNVLSTFGINRTYITIEIMTGDVITPKEIKYHYQCFFEDKKIPILAYNIETILAEKLHAIISHGILTTRLKDYYDVYVIMKSNKISYDKKLLVDAITNTFKNRNKIVNIEEFKEIINDIEKSKTIKHLWEKYQNKNTYAKNIKYEDTILAIKQIINILEKEKVTL